MDALSSESEFTYVSGGHPAYLSGFRGEGGESTAAAKSW